MDGSGRLLRIDLTTRKITREAVPAELYQRFIGGEGINAWLLWEHFLKVDPRIDPLSPANVLIAGVGPLAATGLGAGSKMKFTYKSPAYGLYGDGTVGGGFGSQLRWAGFDYLVITGKSPKPVYIWIHDDAVVIKDASRLWGKDVPATDAAIKAELGDDQVEIACIGQAGENLVRYASIMVSCHRTVGRGGGGCVFGSKNLKAIAARGTNGLAVLDPEGYFEVVDEFREWKRVDPGPGHHLKYGTLSVIRNVHNSGELAYRNHQGRLTPNADVDNVDHAWYAKNIGVRAASCSPGCAYACGGWYHVKGDETEGARRHPDRWGSKPEFGSANPLGPGCGLADLPEICYLNAMCNEYGMDTMEASMTIAFLMELWEKGIITGQDLLEWTGTPMSLEWGNAEAMEQIIESVALRKNRLGEILEGSVYQSALNIEKIKGVPVLKYACYGKGGATHEGSVRSTDLGVACAVAPIGAHHLKGMGIGPKLSQKYFGTPDAGEPFLGSGGQTKPQATTTNYKMRAAGYVLAEIFQEIGNSLGICHFLSTHKAQTSIPLEIYSGALQTTAGITLSPDEILLAAERTTNLQKAFNSRLGLRREDDGVCERWMSEPLLEGFGKGRKVADYLEPYKDEYYQRHGWDRITSLQTRQKLVEMGMADVAEVLAAEGDLADPTPGKKG